MPISILSAAIINFRNTYNDDLNILFAHIDFYLFIIVIIISIEEIVLFCFSKHFFFDGSRPSVANWIRLYSINILNLTGPQLICTLLDWFFFFFLWFLWDSCHSPCPSKDLLSVSAIYPSKWNGFRFRFRQIYFAPVRTVCISICRLQFGNNILSSL